MTQISADLLARIRQAADPQDYGHSINLTRLVDGDSTYTATCCDQTQNFASSSEAYDWVRKVKANASEKDLLAALDEYASSCPVPDGWRLVPIKPTYEMIIEGGDIPWSVQEVWARMLSAAPIAGDA